MRDISFEMEKVSSLLDKAEVHHAAELAYSGSRSSAEGLLVELTGRSPDLVEAWDLRARICAQQGRFEDASICWKEALRIVPGHSAATAGIARIERLRRYPVWLTWAVPSSLVVLVVLLSAVIASGIESGNREQTGRLLQEIARVSHAQSEAFHGMSQRLTSLEERTGAVQSEQNMNTKSLRSLSRIEAELAADRAVRQSLESSLQKHADEVSRLRQEVQAIKRANGITTNR